MRRLSLRAKLSSGVVCALTLCTVLPSIASAQTNSFTTGTAFNAPFLTSAGTTGSLMNGMQVQWTFADGAGSFSASWGDLGVIAGSSFSGVRSGGFEIGVRSDLNSFDALWTLTNLTPNRVQSVRFNGAPGRTLFDCGVGCPDPGTPVSAAGRSLQTVPFGGQYTGGVTGAYTNIVGIGGLAPVGDLYEQLTITFVDILGSNLGYTFRADTDNSDFGVAPPTPAQSVVPEPSTWAMMLLGLAVLSVRARRKA